MQTLSLAPWALPQELNVLMLDYSVERNCGNSKGIRDWVTRNAVDKSEAILRATGRLPK